MSAWKLLMFMLREEMERQKKSCTGCGFAQYATQDECDKCLERRNQDGNENEQGHALAD